MAGAASWSFSESDFKQIQQHLQAFLGDSNARCALLVDRTGQLVATVGDPPSSIPPRSLPSPPPISAPTTSSPRWSASTNSPPSCTRARNRKSTRLNSSHGYISYAVFCLKKKKKRNDTRRVTKQKQSQSSDDKKRRR